MKAKVFCIGFHKTGTTSLKEALEILGYRVTGPNGVNNPGINKNSVLSMAFKLVDDFDAFQDNPWPIIYKEIDERYPGSQFILTLRDSESWIKSQVKHFGSSKTPMRTWIYGVGCPLGNEDTYVNRFESHNIGVQEYFKDRPEDLLIIDLSEGNCWEKLCPFLGLAIPDIPFPHANKAINRATRHSLSNRLARLFQLMPRPLI
jgi:hypothetical protein